MKVKVKVKDTDTLFCHPQLTTHFQSVREVGKPKGRAEVRGTISLRSVVGMLWFPPSLPILPGPPPTCFHRHGE